MIDDITTRNQIYNSSGFEKHTNGKHDIAVKVPETLNGTSLNGRELHVVVLDDRKEDNESELWSEFVAAVASGYRRYNAHQLKRMGLEADKEIVTKHFAVVNENAEIIGTCSLEIANGKGPEVTHMFNGDAAFVHKTLSETWPHGYAEFKNFTAGEGFKDFTPRDKMVVFNLLMHAVANEISTPEDTEPSGIVGIMAPTVADFIQEAGINTISVDLQPNPEGIEKFLPFFQYFFNTFSPRGGQKEGEPLPLMPDEVIELAIRRHPERFDTKKGSAVERFKLDARWKPESFAAQLTLEWLTWAFKQDPGIPSEFHITRERLVAAFVPRVYHIEAREAAAQVIDNLTDLLTPPNEENSIASREARRTLASQASLQEPLFKHIGLNEVRLLASSGVPVIDVWNPPTPKEEGKKYRTIYVLLPAATNIKGIPFYQDTILRMRINQSEKIGYNRFNHEGLRVNYLSHMLTRAITNTFNDFEPGDNVNLSWEERIRIYLTRPNTIYQRLQTMKVAVAGGGTVGLAALHALALLVPTLRLAEKQDQMNDPHNIQRTIGADLSGVGVPKLVLDRRAVQYINPFTKLETIPEPISSLEDARRFVEGQTIVISALDSPEAMYYLHVAAREQHIPLWLVTDVAGGSKVQIFDYRDHKYPLFGGLVSAKQLSIITTGTEEEKQKAFNSFVVALVGGRQTKLGPIPMIDLIAGLPAQTLKFFEAQVKGITPGLAQDRVAAQVTSITIEALILYFAETGMLPKNDTFVIPRDAVIPKGPMLERFRNRISRLKEIITTMSPKKK